jgi:DNA-binding transcriptional MerR regulator
MQTTFTIGDLAKEFGVTLRTLRFYEDKNLLRPRREGQSRIYSRRDRARLTLVLLGKQVGFSLDEIKEMLAFYELREGDTSQLRTALRRFSGQIEMLERQKVAVEQAIEELRRTMSIVAGMLHRGVMAGARAEREQVLEAAE